MTYYLDLSKSKEFSLPILKPDEAKQFSFDGKGWNFSNIYYPLELKNVFIALKRINYIDNKDFTDKAIKDKIPFAETPWKSRRILEHENALVNFGLISKERKPIDNYFIEEEYSNLLNETDIVLFKSIYYSYFVFKEIHSWLLNPVQNDHVSFLDQVTQESMHNNSNPIFPFFINSRFNDAFIFSLNNNTDIYRIPNDKSNQNGGLMRFWDVYVKWGTTLGILEKFNLSSLNIKTINGRNIACAYIINDTLTDFNFLAFLNEHYDNNYIYIPQLVLDLALKFRLSIIRIHKLIIEQYKIHKEFLSFERTSEIFIKKHEIKEKDRILFPKYKDAYVSHLIIRK